MSDNQPAANTDRELFREHTLLTDTAGEYYENSLFVTVDGKLGMNVGGLVFVLPIDGWHALARQEAELFTDVRVAELQRAIDALYTYENPPEFKNWWAKLRFNMNTEAISSNYRIQKWLTARQDHLKKTRPKLGGPQ